MGFPQYLIPLPFCQTKSRLSGTILYPAVPSATCFGQQYCSLLVLVKGECLWIMWLHNLGGQFHLQKQGHLKLSAGFLVVCVDFATFVSGRRKAAICLLSCALLDAMRLSVLYSGVATLETAACPAFLPHYPPTAKLGCVACALHRGLRWNCSGTTGLTAVDWGNLGAFFQAVFGGSLLELVPYECQCFRNNFTEVFWLNGLKNFAQ